MTLEKQLAQLRAERGLSQREVAQELEVTVQAVSRWEQGAAHPSSKNLIALSHLYQVDLGNLIGETEERPMQAEGGKEEENVKSAPHGALRYILGTICICFVALCVAVCVIVLTLGRPQENEDEEGEITSISNLEKGTIDLPIEGQFDIGIWESEEVYNP